MACCCSLKCYFKALLVHIKIFQNLPDFQNIFYDQPIQNLEEKVAKIYLPDWQLCLPQANW